MSIFFYSPGKIFVGEKYSSGQKFRRGKFSPGKIFVGENFRHFSPTKFSPIRYIKYTGMCHSGKCPSGKCPRRSAREGTCPSGMCPSGKCPLGACPSGEVSVKEVPSNCFRWPCCSERDGEPKKAVTNKSCFSSLIVSSHVPVRLLALLSEETELRWPSC